MSVTHKMKHTEYHIAKNCWYKVKNVALVTHYIYLYSTRLNILALRTVHEPHQDKFAAISRQNSFAGRPIQVAVFYISLSIVLKTLADSLLLQRPKPVP